ncbi:MAG: MotA/TolQ/ExbB proton channel family protein [Bradymonadia bacterium]|jgi:biopolymer transport protein ExbB
MDGIKNAFAWDQGGIWMYFILAISIACLGLIIERFTFIFFKYNISASAFMEQIQRSVMSDNIERAVKLCNSQQNAALARVIKAGLTKANRSELEIQNAVEEASLEVIPLVLRRLPMLAALANIATLCGLLGTIIGLINAFGALETASPENRQAMLSRGIAIAMNTTAFGLIVAIPTLLLHMVISSVARKIIEDIELYSTKLNNMLSSRSK